METREDIINRMSERKYSLVDDTGSVLVFKKRFSILWLLCFWFGYVVYHVFLKSKAFVSYKEENK